MKITYIIPLHALRHRVERSLQALYNQTGILCNFPPLATSNSIFQVRENYSISTRQNWTPQKYPE